MAIKTSCLSHPPRARLVMIREEFLAITDGHHCAAALLAVLEYWTNWKLDHIARQVEDFHELGKDTGLIEREPWIYKNNQSFQDDLMGLFGRNKVLDGLAKLIDVGFVKRRKNPGMGWDRTYQYMLDTEKVQQAIDELKRFKNKPLTYKQTELSGLNLNPIESEFKPNEVPDQTTSGLNLNPTESESGLNGVPDQTPSSLKKDEQYQRIQTENTKENTIESTTGETELAVVAIHLDELKYLTLTTNQVIVADPDDEERFWVQLLSDIVKSDIRAAGSYDDLRLYAFRQEVFYSVAHVLGEGGDEWSAAEARKIRRRERLEQELGERFNRLGAFSIEEALAAYFAPDLAQQFLAEADDAEYHRIEAWIAHTRQAQSLKNPAGFLRSKIERGEAAPEEGTL